MNLVSQLTHSMAWVLPLLRFPDRTYPLGERVLRVALWSIGMSFVVNRIVSPAIGWSWKRIESRLATWAPYRRIFIAYFSRDKRVSREIDEVEDFLRTRGVALTPLESERLCMFICRIDTLYDKSRLLDALEALSRLDWLDKSDNFNRVLSLPLQRLYNMGYTLRGLYSLRHLAPNGDAVLRAYERDPESTGYWPSTTFFSDLEQGGFFSPDNPQCQANFDRLLPRINVAVYIQSVWASLSRGGRTQANYELLIEHATNDWVQEQSNVTHEQTRAAFFCLRNDVVLSRFRAVEAFLSHTQQIKSSNVSAIITSYVMSTDGVELPPPPPNIAQN